MHLDPERLQAAVLHLLSFARRRGAAMVALTGTEVVVEARTADRPMLRKGRYGCLDFELVGAIITAFGLVGAALVRLGSRAIGKK